MSRLPEWSEVIAEKDAEIERLKAALEWYAEMADKCRRITSEGEVARNALDADGGKRARAALQPTQEPRI